MDFTSVDFVSIAEIVGAIALVATLIFIGFELRHSARTARGAVLQANLSAAEGQLVALIAAGKNLTEAANCAGISYNTAKTQLKSVFAKTQFKRQADLVADVRANSLIRLSGQ